MIKFSRGWDDNQNHLNSEVEKEGREEANLETTHSKIMCELSPSMDSASAIHKQQLEN